MGESPWGFKSLRPHLGSAADPVTTSRYDRSVAVERMDHVAVVVDDLPAAIAFFVALGLELTGETSVEGETVDRITGLEGVRSELAFLQTPDGHGKLEIVRYHSPEPEPTPAGGLPRANARGLNHLLFAVDDVDATFARLRPHGAELVGTIEDYGTSYRLCYLRGPGGMIIELAEKLGPPPAGPAAPDDDELGGRLELRDPAGLDGAARRLYDELQAGPLQRGRDFGYKAELADGRLIGPFNSMLLTPEVAQGMLAWGEAEVRTSSLDERMRQVVTLAAGSAWGSGYELYAHSTAARVAGFSATAVESLAAGTGSEEMSAKERAAYEFVRRLSAERHVDDALYAKTKEILGEDVLAEVVMLGARYQVTCFVLNAYDVPVPR